jgi:hypothetical protein
LWYSLFDLRCFYCASEECIDVVFETHCFEVGHASFAASVNDFIGEVASVRVVLDLELVFEPGDNEDISELHLLFDAVAGLIFTSCCHRNRLRSPDLIRPAVAGHLLLEEKDNGASRVSS